MKRNVELLQKTLQHIMDNPHSHIQDEWWCGTTGCYFGWAVALSDLELDAGQWTIITPGPYQHQDLPVAAQSLLGLTKHEADVLSMGSNTRPMLELMVKDLANGDELLSEDYYRHSAPEDD